MSIELQVGKRYERVGGQAGECVEYRKDELNDIFPFAMDFGFGKHWYSVDGRSIVGPEYNIVRELPDASSTPEPAAEPEPVSDTQAPLRLEVGKFYRTRDGKIAEVKGVDDGSFYNDFTGNVGEFYCQWNSAGVFDGEQGETVFDLIEEIPAPVAEAVAEMDFKIEYEQAGPEPSESPSDPSMTFTAWSVEQPRSDADATDAWFRTNVADTRAGIVRKYAQATMFVMLGIAAIIFAIGTSVQA